MLGSHILYLKGIRRMMFQLSGFYYMGSIIGDNIGATTGIPSPLPYSAPGGCCCLLFRA